MNRLVLTKAQGIWKCVGAESGTPFNEVELEEGEWVDYDEKVRVSLSSQYRLNRFHTGGTACWCLCNRKRMAQSMMCTS